MSKKKLGLFLILLICGLVIPVEKSYGHGIGLETIKTASIDGRQLALTAQISPTEFTDGKKNIVVSLADSFTNQNISSVTFVIGLYHEGKLIFKDRFFASNGMVIISVNPDIDSQIQLRGERDADLDAWYGTETTPIQLVGPVFDSGGPYHFEIEIETIDSPTNFIDSETYVADVSLITRQPFEETDKNGNGVTFGIISYYDEISSFDYEPETNMIRFDMPFDWSEQNISHVPFVHEEVHFPKDFGDFFAPSYEGKVNGIDLFKSSVTVDDYSRENERIVHFVISQDSLNFLKQQQKASGVESPQNMEFTLKASDKLVFPIIAMTKNEEIQVDLSWDPIVIEPDKNTKFIYTFRDAKTGETLRNTNYDFIILQNGKELYKKSGNARIGGDFADYTFLEGQTGHATIRFENLRGTDMNTEFVITVIPEFGPLVFVMLPAAIAVALIISRRFRLVL